MGRYLDIIAEASAKIKAAEESENDARLRTSLCRGCGEEIYFVPSTNGKPMPLNIKSDKRIILLGFMAHVVDTYVSHFATCPKAEQFRKDS